MIRSTRRTRMTQQTLCGGLLNKPTLCFLMLVCALLGCDDAGEDGMDAGMGGLGGMTGTGGDPTGGGGPAPADASVDVFADAPECNDGVDNDGDGLTDFPEDPGCEDAVDTSERERACANGIDDDEDGATDFPADPGCASYEDDDEFNEAPLPECADGIDNDRNGEIDEQDPGCVSAADPSEDTPAEPPVCADRIDNDMDGIIDFPLEPGCIAAGDGDEQDPAGLTACGNQVDDDGDGLTDYPADPGCMGVGDQNEEDKQVSPECADGQDNDLDGRTDYPDDDGCVAASDSSEKGSCGDTYSPPTLTNGTTVTLNLSQGIFSSAGSCGGDGSPERVTLYRVTTPIEALEVTTVGEGTRVPTNLYVRYADCLESETEVACGSESPGIPIPGQTLRIDFPPVGEYFIFVDGVAGAGGQVDLTVREVPLAQCLNQSDDDEDGRIDYPNDPGCADPNDRTEATPAVLPACGNDADDDGDGEVDYPADPGCTSASADDETDVCGAGVRLRRYHFGQREVIASTDERDGASNALNPSCANEGRTEVVFVYQNPYVAQLDISTAHEETEANTVVYVRSACRSANSELACGAGSRESRRGVVSMSEVEPGTYYIIVDTSIGIGGQFKLTVESQRDDPACSDMQDNDGDGLVDLEDSGCIAPDDRGERDPLRDPPCANGMDDDGDGLIDFPLDPGCRARGDQDEEDPAVAPACANGMDDDGDGLVDFAEDPGCAGAGDGEETDPLTPAECGDGEDNDADGRIDFPADPQCNGPGDLSERR